MVHEFDPDAAGRTRGADAASYRRPRAGWQRRANDGRQTVQSRRTLCDGDALSPAEEILARHDAELAADNQTVEATAATDTGQRTQPHSTDTFCF